MLVLTRRPEQSIIIGDPKAPYAAEDTVEVFVVEIRGDQVRLGVRAPRHVPVHRAEVYADIQAEIQARTQ